MSQGDPRSSPPLVFLSAVFGGSILLSLAIGLSGGHTSSLIGLATLSMFLPALGVLAVRIALAVPLQIEWNRLPLRWVPIAVLSLPLAIHAIALPGVVWLEGRLPWAAWLTSDPDDLYHTPTWGMLAWSALAGHIAVNALFGLIFVSFLGFFEEVGWRAFMLPRLVERFGVRGGVAASALIFALWHIPFALSGISYVEHVSPRAVALVSPVGQFGAGLFLAFLWLRTRSILLVSLAHGALNNWGQYAFKYMSTSGERDLALFALVNIALFAAGIVARALTTDPCQRRACRSRTR